MKVRVIQKSNVKRHIGNDNTMLGYFDAFFDKLDYVDWRIPQDIIISFKSADLVKCKKGEWDRIVFNIGNNKYRLICGYWFGEKEVSLYIKFVGKQQEYDLIEVCKISMFK